MTGSGQIDAIPASLLPVALLVDGSVTSTNLKDELAPKMARLAEPMHVGSLGQPIKLDLRRALGADPIQLHNAFEMPAGGSQNMIIRRPVSPESIFEQQTTVTLSVASSRWLWHAPCGRDLTSCRGSSRPWSSDMISPALP